MNHGENDKLVPRSAGKKAEASCTYCGWALDDSEGGWGDNHMRVPVPCPHGGFVHVCCMLELAEHLARGHVDPTFCVTCHSEWAG